MKLILVVAGILMCAVQLRAETYSWVDDTGTANFTDDYSNIPAKYSKKAKRLGNIEAESPPVPTEVINKKKAAQGSLAPVDTGPASAGEADGLYGGRKPSEWQQQMRQLFVEVTRLEQQLVELEALIRKPGSISKSRADGLPQEFRETQIQYRQALAQYNRLNDEANKAGLPAEFRK
jgi:hypothetical protein